MDKTEFLKSIMVELRGCDYIAEHYHEMSRWELKELLMATMYIALDKFNDDGEFYRMLVDELQHRDFFDE